jgi:hypothetical protein
MDAVYAALVTTKKAAGIWPVKILQIAAGAAVRTSSCLNSRYGIRNLVEISEKLGFSFVIKIIPDSDAMACSLF